MEIDKKILEEATRYIRENDGLKATQFSYGSPRFSAEFSDCSMPLTFDSLSRCSLSCLYCFAYFQKNWNPGVVHKAPPLNAVDTEKIKQMVLGTLPQHGPVDKNWMAFHKYFFKKRFLLHWGGLADPFCNFERENGISYNLLDFLGIEAYPTLMSFKGDTILDKKYEKLMDKYSKQRNFAFQCSIVTADDKLAKYVEMGVPSPSRRFEILRMLSDMGYWTILRLRPFIIGITDKSLDELLEKALAAGVRAISTEFFAIDCRCSEGMHTRYDWLAKLIGTKDLMAYYNALSPAERGSYMRLNRDVKEQHIRKIYEFCQKHGLVLGVSDPDFKELCTSGSCCAMPDSFPENPEMCNWSTAQLTYHVKNARIAYHKTGEEQLIKFNEVYDNEKWEHLNIWRFANDYVGVIGLNGAERQLVTPKRILQYEWNNLRSPKCPRNYLHGKVMPAGLDEDGNYIFKYTPKPYEQRWKDKGIDLTYGG